MDATKTQLQWIVPPRQARTHQVLERLLSAAAQLLEQKGFDDMSVAEVASRADTSVGALYRRFHDKEGLLHALHERYCEEAFATADAALDPARWERAGIADIVSETVRFLVEVFQQHRALDRAVFQRSISDARFRERSSRLQRHVLSGLSQLLLARAEQIAHPEPRLAVDVALRQVVAFLDLHYVVGHTEMELVALSDEQVTRELTLGCLAYLGVREADASPPIASS